MSRRSRPKRHWRQDGNYGELSLSFRPFRFCYFIHCVSYVDCVHCVRCVRCVGWKPRLSYFLRATACNARLCYGRGVLLSVCLSVTLLYCVKTTQLRIMKFTLWATTRTLVSNEVILVPLGEEIPLEQGHQTGVPPPLEIVILTPLAHLA